MKHETVIALTGNFEAHAQETEGGIEFWLARDLQHLLGYSKWDNFLNVVTKAKTACDVSGHEVLDHFADVGKMVDIGSRVTREIDDVMLTRYACYLIAQSGDPKNGLVTRICGLRSGRESRLACVFQAFQGKKNVSRFGPHDAAPGGIGRPGRSWHSFRPDPERSRVSPRQRRSQSPALFPSSVSQLCFTAPFPLAKSARRHDGTPRSLCRPPRLRQPFFLPCRCLKNASRLIASRPITRKFWLGAGKFGLIRSKGDQTHGGQPGKKVGQNDS